MFADDEYIGDAVHGFEEVVATANKMFKMAKVADAPPF